MASTVAPDVSASPESGEKRIDFHRMNRKAWIVTALLVLFQIVAFADKAVLGLVASEAMPDLGISAVEFGFSLEHLFVRLDGRQPLESVLDPEVEIRLKFLTPAGVHVVVETVAGLLEVLWDAFKAARDHLEPLGQGRVVADE